MVFKMFSESV